MGDRCDYLLVPDSERAFKAAERLKRYGDVQVSPPAEESRQWVVSLKTRLNETPPLGMLAGIAEALGGEYGGSEMKDG